MNWWHFLQNNFFAGDGPQGGDTDLPNNRDDAHEPLHDSDYGDAGGNNY